MFCHGLTFLSSFSQVSELHRSFVNMKLTYSTAAYNFEYSHLRAFRARLADCIRLERGENGAVRLAVAP